MAKDYVAIARQYEDDVLAGVIPACKWVKLACERNVKDLARQHTKTFAYRFDAGAAAKVCIAAEHLPHIEGPKAKVIGWDAESRPVWATIDLEPWQCWLLTTIFGWQRVDDGLRRFRVALVLVPRKNAKSTIAAVVALYMLTADGESGAQCYSAATTRDQAKAVAKIVWEMAKRSPQFTEYFGVRVGAKTTRVVEVPATASEFKPLSADANSLDGLNVSLAVVDELHAHKTRGVWDVLETATGARSQPLLMPITTAGIDLGGICYEKVTYLHKILENVLPDEEFFGVEYTIDEGDDYRDANSHRKANPNLGVSVDASDLKRKARQAEHSPAALDAFLTKHLNVWVRREASWMPMRQWIASGDPRLKMEDFKQHPCWIGVDLAEVRDIAAIVALFRPDADRYVAFGKYFLPKKTIQQSPIAQLSGWVREGHIIETDGDQADFLRIEDAIMDWVNGYKVREIDFDRALAAMMGQNLKRRLLPRMGADAIENFVITVNQDVATINPAMQMVTSLTLAGNFLHDGNPALNWMFSNIVVEPNYKGEVYPRKLGGKDSPNKIDGPMALYTTFSRASQANIGPPPKRRKPMVYTPSGFMPATPVKETHAPTP